MVSRRPSGEPRLAGVQRQIEDWRRTRTHGPMPPRLWAAAVALSERHGLYRTARALRIDYGALRRHVATGQGCATHPGRPTFIELPLRKVKPDLDKAAAPRACAIEIESPRGRLRLTIPDLPLHEVATLSRLLAGLDA